MALQRDLKSFESDLTEMSESNDRLRATKSKLLQEIENLKELVARNALEKQEFQHENELLQLKIKNLELEANRIDNHRLRIEQESKMKISKLNEYIYNLGKCSNEKIF